MSLASLGLGFSIFFGATVTGFIYGFSFFSTGFSSFGFFANRDGFTCGFFGSFGETVGLRSCFSVFDGRIALFSCFTAAGALDDGFCTYFYLGDDTHFYYFGDDVYF